MKKIKLICFLTVKLVPIFSQYLSLTDQPQNNCYNLFTDKYIRSLLRTKKIILNENIDSFMQ